MLALLSRRHEGVNFQRFLRRHRRLLRLEKFHDLPQHRRVVAVGFLLGDLLVAKTDHLKSHRPFMNRLQRPSAPACPKSRHNGFRRRGRANDGKAAGTHHGKQRLRRMYPVEEQVRVVRQHMRRTERNGAARRRRLRIGHFQHARVPAYGRRAEHRHLRCCSQLVDFHRILQRGRHRLVHEDRFANRKDLLHLLQPRPPFQAQQQHRIHIFAGLRHTPNDAHAKLVSHRCREAFHSRLALFNVRAASRKGHHHPRSGDVVGIRRIVQSQRELF